MMLGVPLSLAALSDPRNNKRQRELLVVFTVTYLHLLGILVLRPHRARFTVSSVCRPRGS